MKTRNPDVVLSEIAQNKEAIARENSKIREAEKDIARENSKIREVEKAKNGYLKKKKALEDKVRALETELSDSKKAFEKDLRSKYRQLLRDAYYGKIDPPYSLTHTFIKIEVESWGKKLYRYYPVLNPIKKKGEAVQNRSYKVDSYCICALKDSVAQRALEESLKKGGVKIYDVGTSKKQNACPVFKQSRIILAYLYFAGCGMSDEDAFERARLFVAFADSQMKGKSIISAIYEAEKPYAKKGSD